MLRRKIEKYLLEWKNTPNHNPLIIKGCRQCGKTSSVIDFAKRNYKHTIYINFFENPSYTSIFNGSLNIDDLTMYITGLLGDKAIFEPEKIKFLMEFDEIATSDPNLKIHMNIFIYDGILEGELTISDEIEKFMWFGRNDDRNILSNTLKNEIIPYAIENSLI